MADFFAGQSRHTPAAPVLAALSPDELARLKARQAAYLVDLMAPETDRESVRRNAQTIGQVHALTGVDNMVMMQTIGLYQSHLARHLATQPLRSHDRRDLMAVAVARLLEDNAVQMQARARTVGAYFDALFHRPQRTDSPWADVLQAFLDAIAALPGIASARLVRPDMTGRFQTLASSSTAGLPFGGLGEDEGLMASIDRDRPEGRGLLSQAWHSDAITSTVSYHTDPRTAPWHALARRFGVRSAVALPVRDADNRPVAMLMLFGAFPNQFEFDVDSARLYRPRAGTVPALAASSCGRGGCPGAGMDGCRVAPTPVQRRPAHALPADRRSAHREAGQG